MIKISMRRCRLMCWRPSRAAGHAPAPLHPGVPVVVARQCQDRCAHFTQLGVDFEHIEALRDLPLHHNDPFDRLLLAQAMVEHATLVTHGRALAPYGVPTLWF